MTDFEVIYTRYFQDVYRYVLFLCRNEAEAEEITQEAFSKAMEHIGQFDGSCRLYVWLCQIAKNTFYTYARRQKRRAPEEDAAYLRQTVPSAESTVLERGPAWQLHQLREPYREVFSLRVFGELPFSQIGQLFGKSDSWARLVFYRARKELRRDSDENDL